MLQIREREGAGVGRTLISSRLNTLILHVTVFWLLFFKTLFRTMKYLFVKLTVAKHEEGRGIKRADIIGGRLEHNMTLYDGYENAVKFLHNT